MTNEFKRMQQIAGIITENINEDEEAGSILGNTGYDGNLADSVQALEDYLKTTLEDYLKTTGAELDYKELASLVIDIVNDAKNESDF
jgi:hypothetical protein